MSQFLDLEFSCSSPQCLQRCSQLDELICNANYSLNYESNLLELLYQDMCTVRRFIFFLHNSPRNHHPNLKSRFFILMPIHFEFRTLSLA
uniref:Uncharacterized protein n=1 Tax=Lotus japonicus TaxID=34305 RepID=I3SQV5_LOTJA|nr:unknown [Lotus japonicus]